MNCPNHLDGARQSITRFIETSNEFWALKTYLDVLAKDVESEKDITKTNQSFMAYSKLSEMVEGKACRFNFESQTLQEEYLYFKSFLSDEICAGLDKIVNKLSIAPHLSIPTN
jgi:hypothetical protein